MIVATHKQSCYSVLILRNTRMFFLSITVQIIFFRTMRIKVNWGKYDIKVMFYKTENPSAY